MKKLILLLFVMFFIENYGQNLSCSVIEKGIIDSVLYDKINKDKLIFKPDLNEFKVYKINTSKNEYYVTKQLMKKIKCFIRKNKCRDVIISKIPVKK